MDIEDMTEEDYHALAQQLAATLARYRKARGEPTDDTADGKEVPPTGG
jgi:hypothetical protein